MPVINKRKYYKSSTEKIYSIVNKYNDSKLEDCQREFKKLSKIEKNELFNYISNLNMYNKIDFMLFLIRIQYIM